MNEGNHDEIEQARVLVTPGDGVLSRRGAALLFFPSVSDAAEHRVVERLLTRLRNGDDLDLDDESTPPHASIDWHAELRCTGTIEVDHDPEAGTVSCASRTDATTALTDLSDGTVRAGGFCLTLDRVGPAAPPHGRNTAAVEPPQFAELSELDVTLTPLGPVTYPDDVTDRTTQQPFDVRCRNGHANARLTTSCRICDEAIDTTARRSAPRPANALAGVELPDGRVEPIDQTLVVGRDPQAVAARAKDRARLVQLDAPATVSRTHLVVRIENRTVTVTDCDSRGRSAVLHAGDAAPVALTPWEPTEVSIGDSVHLGGPTTLMIVEPRLHRAATHASDPTERPRDET